MGWFLIWASSDALSTDLSTVAISLSFWSNNLTDFFNKAKPESWQKHQKLKFLKVRFVITYMTQKSYRIKNLERILDFTKLYHFN